MVEGERNRRQRFGKKDLKIHKHTKTKQTHAYIERWRKNTHTETGIIGRRPVKFNGYVAMV